MLRPFEELRIGNFGIDQKRFWVKRLDLIAIELDDEFSACRGWRLEATLIDTTNTNGVNL